MEVTTVEIPGLLVFTPRPHPDQRGFFSRTFDAEIARQAGLDPCAFVQDSMSRSVRGVVRGLHVGSVVVKASWSDAPQGDL